MTRLKKYFHAHKKLQKKNKYPPSKRILIVDNQDLYYDYSLNREKFLNCYLQHKVYNISLLQTDRGKSHDSKKEITDRYADRQSRLIGAEFGIWIDDFALQTYIDHDQNKQTTLALGLPGESKYNILLDYFELLLKESREIIVKVNNKEFSDLFFEYIIQENDRKGYPKISVDDIRKNFEKLIHKLFSQEYVNTDIDCILEEHLRHLFCVDKRWENSEQKIVLGPHKDSSGAKKLELYFKGKLRDPLQDTLLAQSCSNFENCQNRLVKTKPFLEGILSKNHYTNILDTGFGTGCECILLHPRGYKYECNQKSELLRGFIEKRLNEYHVEEVPIYHHDWRELSFTLEKRYDIVLFFGNNLSTLYDSEEDRDRVVKQLFEILKPGGVLLIDHRNYDKIKEYLKCVKQPSAETFYDEWYSADYIFCGKKFRGWPVSLESPQTVIFEYEVARMDLSPEENTLANTITNYIT
jgi:SAM-dependent methyltransferase